MDKDIWLKASFTKKRVPDWPCPHCSKATLRFDTFKSEETALSKTFHSNEDWGPEFLHYSFTGSLTCPSCNEFVAFLGSGSEEFDYYYDDYHDQHVEKNYSLFYPKYFFPALQLFKIPDKCPSDVKQAISDSFALYWNDRSSCANKIRVSLELLMNQLKVRKYLITEQRIKKRLSLHARIEAFKTSKPDIADFLLAIKWIGNTGSHSGKIEEIDILEAYEMLELTLNKLYDNKEDELKRVAKAINKRKGTRKRD